MVAEAQPRVNNGSPYKIPQTKSAEASQPVIQYTVPGATAAKSVPPSPQAGYKLPSGASQPSSPGAYKLPGSISKPMTPASVKMPCCIKSLARSSSDLPSGDSSPTSTAQSTVASSQGSSVDEASQNWFAENQVPERIDASFSSPSGAVAGSLVTAKLGEEAVQRRHRVVVTESYTARVPVTDRSLSEEGCGIIVKIYSMGAPGHICDVIWDNGKFYQGYCIGYDGMHDLALAAPENSKRARTSTPGKQESTASRMLLGSGSKTSSIDLSENVASPGPGVDGSNLPKIDCLVAYIGSAPRIDRTHRTSLWDDSAEPLFKRYQ